ncbi:Oidioi.mRNA.OKI2018_I69.chr1.g2536.t1.cds [Oikopleura dioica]|uniref:Oidioi.mRNA.OKI2018_I69.chr1.g2536.t1.cds n=1 Tax=Oikopleura dioica TaxID=34765 RepID=A0ABN7SXS6_OIKDI|nr:Oidioi.mRNA.OKI2018_I69.chr1.g2536.t1.cds [Oikopleura dioica]
MCGILAVFGLEGHPENYEKNFLENLDCMEHRGQDSTGFYWGENFILGHLRLGFVGGTSGTQPLSSYDSSIVCIANGEIYNYKSIWKQLDKIDPTINKQRRSESDCETFITCYQAFGPNFLQKVDLVGMFAFILVDMKKQKVIIGRDFGGKVPLHFCKDKNGESWFASEKKGLMNQVEHMDEIFDFPIGKYYLIDRIQQTKQVKTIPNNPLQHSFAPIKNWSTEEILTKFCIAVERIIPEKIPFAVLLDGSIYAELLFHAIQGRVNDKKRIFPIILHGDFFYSDDDIRKLQKEYGCDLHAITISPSRILEDIEDIMYAIESADPAKIFEGSTIYYGNFFID